MRQILFLGNCQAGSLAGTYRERVAPETGDRVSYISTAWPLSDAEAELIKTADVIVDQVFDAKQTVALEDLAPGGRVVRFPTVSGAFLWPFTGQAHPANASFYFLDDGPYPPEVGDRYLNQMIAERVEPDEAVARYLELDVAATVDLDKRYAASIRQQRRRDAVAEWQIADMIETSFQDEYIFCSPLHPGSRLFRMLMTELLGRIGVDPASAARLQWSLKPRPIDDRWLPIHPSVARHFGLGYIAENQRYRFPEGYFIFAEWAQRYMRFDWNPLLAEGAFLAHKPATGVEKVQIGLLRSPDSARGHAILAEYLYRLERIDYAAAALERAIELDPDEPRFRASLGHVLSRKGEAEPAVLAFRAALDLDPDDPAIHSALSHTLCALERFEEAIGPARRALEMDPDHARTAHLGNIYSRCGHWQEAELAYRQALESGPDDAEVRGDLGRALAAQGRPDEAVAEFRRALALDPENPELLAELAGLQTDQETAPGHAEEPLLEAAPVTAPGEADGMPFDAFNSGTVDLGAIPPMDPEPAPPRPDHPAEEIGAPLAADAQTSGGSDNSGSGNGRASLRLPPILGSALERARSAVARVGSRAPQR